ncbi:hypothetical protein BGX34_001316, partial [Mortierella sp. NVP85]
MDKTQHFRLTGTNAVEKIPYGHVDGYNVIYWEDIERVFPGAKHIKCDGAIVNLLRGSDRKRIEPDCIKHHPDVVLDVVVSSSDENTSAAVGRTMDATDASTAEHIVEDLQVARPSDASNSSTRTCIPSRTTILPSAGTLSDFKSEPMASLPLKQVDDVGLAQKLLMESKFEQQLILSHSSSAHEQACGITDVSEPLIQVIKDGAVRLHELSVNVSEIKDTTAVILELVSMNNKLMFENNQLASKNNQLASENKIQLAQITLLQLDIASKQEDLASKQEEMKELQKQALDRLAQLQNGVQAILTQTYELHEYPIPRLFIVLPDDRSSWNPLDFFSNKFRLYFLCECGEHTKATKSNIPHRIHLAKHEGYDIERPNEFFQQYGSYVLTILKML